MSFFIKILGWPLGLVNLLNKIKIITNLIHLGKIHWHNFRKESFKYVFLCNLYLKDKILCQILDRKYNNAKIYNYSQIYKNLIYLKFKFFLRFTLFCEIITNIFLVKEITLVSIITITPLVLMARLHLT